MRKLLLVSLVCIVIPILVGCANVSEPNEFINYDEDAIITLAKSLEGDSNLESIWNVVGWVYENIDYRIESVDECVDRSATDVLDKGWGDCSSMSKLTAALLRAIDIPADLMSGCASDDYGKWMNCGWVFAAVPPPGKVKGPRVEPLRFEDGLPVISGGSHAWVKAWTGSKWVYVEATSGEVFELSCNGYHEEYVSDETGWDLCVMDFGDFEENYALYQDWINFCGAF